MQGRVQVKHGSCTQPRGQASTSHSQDGHQSPFGQPGETSLVHGTSKWRALESVLGHERRFPTESGILPGHMDQLIHRYSVTVIMQGPIWCMCVVRGCFSIIAMRQSAFQRLGKNQERPRMLAHIDKAKGEAIERKEPSNRRVRASSSSVSYRIEDYRDNQPVFQMSAPEISHNLASRQAHSLRSSWKETGWGEEERAPPMLAILSTTTHHLTNPPTTFEVRTL